MVKVCLNCGVEKDEIEFYVKDPSTGRRDSKCKTCTRGDRKSYYEENKETISETHREWYQNNKEKVFKDVVRWQKHNPDKVRRYNRTTTSRMRRTDPDRLTARNKRKEKKVLEKPSNRIAKSLRGRIRAILNGKIRSGSSVRDLGCSLDVLKLRLENLWAPGMCWDNYGQGLGKWSIDHIIPLTAFDLEDRQHFILACNYLNLQPLWHSENASKGNRLDFEFRRFDTTIPVGSTNTE